VRAGLEALPREASLVAIHDAARPLVRVAAVARVLATARREGAAILAFPVPDTLKIVRDGRVIATPERAHCYAAQTPQVFRVELLREALAKADAEGRLASDDAQLVEWLGAPVAIVEGDPDNLKLTHPEDFAVAERWLAAREGQPA
jgi:2-C-methyl-D-erythritol 4-phosphate cytidylyltransferase